MFCTKCGSKNENDILFCTSCGEKLVGEKNTTTISIGIDGLDVKSESKNFITVLKESVVSPFNIGGSKSVLSLKKSIIYIAIVALITALINVFNIKISIDSILELSRMNSFMNSSFMFDTTKVTIALFLSVTALFLIIPAILFFMFKKLKRENVSIVVFFNISLVAIIVNLFFSILNIVLLRIDPIIFLISLVTGSMLILGIFYVNIASVVSDKTLLAYSFPVVYIITSYFVCKVLAGEIIKVIITSPLFDFM